MIVTLPRTRSSTMKLRPVTSLTNFASTGISTSWKLSATVASLGAAAAAAARARQASARSVARIIGAPAPSSEVVDHGAALGAAPDVERDPRLGPQPLQEGEQGRGIGDRL